MECANFIAKREEEERKLNEQLKLEQEERDRARTENSVNGENRDNKFASV